MPRICGQRQMPKHWQEPVVGEQPQQQSFVAARKVVEDKDDNPKQKKSKEKKEPPKKPEDSPISDGIFDDKEEGTWEIPDHVH